MARAAAPRLKPPSKAAWSKDVEQRSLAPSAALLREARANTRSASADPAFLAALAREIVLTRGAELTLAYRSLVWLTPGFRKKRRGSRLRVLSEVCVVLVVRRKTTLAADAAQRLPRWLITFAEHDGQRKPFALPTDVQDAAEHHRAVAHADSAVSVRNGSWPAAQGSLTCLVKLQHDSGSQTCLLSAQHVLTPFADGESPRLTSGLPLLPLGAGGAELAAPRLALSLPWGGRLRADQRPERPSFDVQLAAIEGPGETLLRRSLALRRLHPTQPWVRSMDEMLMLDRSTWFHLLSPDNHATSPGRGAVRLTLSAMPATPFGIPYWFAGTPQALRREVFHAELLQLVAVDSRRPQPGDSGSPIVVRRQDGTMTLAAMHIGGDGSGLSWAIPAWRLFDIDNWSQHPAGARIEPVDP